MTPVPSGEEVEKFRELVAYRVGLRCEGWRTDQLADLLARRAQARGIGCLKYLEMLSTSSQQSGEAAALAGELTVPETYFFRNVEQFHVLSDIVFRERAGARKSEREFRVVSAGCATGEEPYTIAMMMRARLPAGWRLSITGVDLNSRVLEHARRGRYSEWAMRETSDDMRRRWFTQSGREYVLAPEILASVEFLQRNLATEDPKLWSLGSLDAVFCRNVIMYFDREQAQSLINRIAGALAPGGYLFLGHAETLRNLSSDFDLVHALGTFAYRKRASGRKPTRGSLQVSETAHGIGPQDVIDIYSAADTAWVDSIRLASDRVEQLAQTTENPVAHATKKIARDVLLAPALELLRREQYAAALELLDNGHPEEFVDPDVLMLRAVLMTHCGDTDRALDIADKLIEDDSLNAGAYYVRAICLERQGNLEGAAECDRVAAHLDPEFAMPRLHLGLLLRRLGKTEDAAKEFALARMLFKQENAARILLFGGGFGRQALGVICDSQMAGSKGSA